MKNRISNNRLRWTGLLLVLIAVMFVLRVQYASSYASTWDQVDFALALERFDLLAMQPHFPGYPYFILGGMMFNQWVSDPALALSLFNIGMALLSCLPIYWLGRRKFSVNMSLLLVLLIQSSSYLWIITSQPMSEAAAIAVLWWYLWSLQLAIEKRSFFAMVLPLFMFGLLMGVRLSFLSFGFGILMLWIYDGRQAGNRTWRWWLTLSFFAVFFQAVWVAGLVLAEGNLPGFINMAKGFIGGHFTEWGGAVSDSSTPLYQRAILLLFNNFIWTGLMGRSIWAALLLGGLLGIILRLKPKWRSIVETMRADRFGCWLVVLFLVYFLWALLAQNIEKPRHISPLIGLILFIGFRFFREGYIKSIADNTSLWRTLKLVILISLIAVQISNGYMLVKQQANTLPASYQLAYELKKVEDDFIVYTWEETRIMTYLEVPFEHRRIHTYEYFLQEVRQRKGQRIFVTRHVLQGFEQQAGNLRDQVKEVKVFKSNALFNPVYHHIVLYEWIRG